MQLPPPTSARARRLRPLTALGWVLCGAMVVHAHAPKAKLIWATTTPLRNGKDVTYDTKAEYSDERIAARNAVAAEIVAAQKIATVDLNAAVRGHPEFHSDNVHFNGQGSQILAAQVCAAVAKLLPP